MENKLLTKVEPVKLPLKVKIIYASGDLAKTLLVVSTMSFLLYFYTDVIGINSGVAATIILIAKIWDIINDPMMGAIVDRTKSKEGKCRVWLKYLSVPGGVVLALAFMMPELSASGKIVWVAVTYTLQGMASTALMIPLNTLMGRLTSDPVQRANLNQIKGVFSTIASLSVPALTMPLVAAFGQGDMQKGFFFVGIIYGIIYAAIHLLVFWGTRGCEPLEHLEEAESGLPQGKDGKLQPSIGQVLKALMKNTPWLLCIALYLIDMIASSIANTVTTFYCQYNLGNINLMSPIALAISISGIVVYVCLGFFVKRFGNAGTGAIGCVLAAAGFGLRFLFHDANLLVIFAGCIILGFGCALAGSTVLLCIFDAKVYGEWKTGVDNEAILMSGYSVSYKTGQALGNPIAGYLMLLVPYVPQAAMQQESVLNLFFYESTLIPAVGFAIAFIFAMMLRKFERKVPEMRAEIEARKEKATA